MSKPRRPTTSPPAASTKVIDKERRGEYLGKTVQIIFHITDEIKRCVQILGSKHDYDFVITEIGGTVGDIESLPYIEAVRQMKWESPEDTLVVHLHLGAVPECRR